MEFLSFSFFTFVFLISPREGKYFLNQMNTTFETDIDSKGYIDLAIDPELDLVEEITRLKKREECCYSCSLLPGIRNSGYSRLYRR